LGEVLDRSLSASLDQGVYEGFIQAERLKHFGIGGIEVDPRRRILNRPRAAEPSSKVDRCGVREPLLRPACLGDRETCFGGPPAAGQDDAVRARLVAEAGGGHREADERCERRDQPQDGDEGKSAIVSGRPLLSTR
jgi:hypothetical protein